jgi:tRNA(Ile)-lysidine synthase
MPGLALGYLGQCGITGNRNPLADRAECDLPRLVHPALPALWDEAGIVAVPHLGYSRPGPATLPALAFRPLNPLSLAGFTVV